MEFTYEKRNEVKKYLKDMFDDKAVEIDEFMFLLNTDSESAISQFDIFIRDSCWHWVSNYVLGIMDNEYDEIMDELNRNIEVSKEDIEREKSFIFEGQSGTNRNNLFKYECELEIFEYLKKKFSNLDKFSSI